MNAPTPTDEFVRDVPCEVREAILPLLRNAVDALCNTREEERKLAHARVALRQFAKKHVQYVVDRNFLLNSSHGTECGVAIDYQDTIQRLPRVRIFDSTWPEFDVMSVDMRQE